MYQQIITHKVIKLWLSTLVWEIILISEYINITYKSFIKYVHINTITCKTKEVHTTVIQNQNIRLLVCKANLTS